jgi:hypothetical protein
VVGIFDLIEFSVKHYFFPDALHIAMEIDHFEVEFEEAPTNQPKLSTSYFFSEVEQIDWITDRQTFMKNVAIRAKAKQREETAKEETVKEPADAADTPELALLAGL